jgi:arylsulfatase
VVILIDDAGFGQFSTFGGGVPSPTMDKLAAEGLRYNRFHTTALCSPTRAALLTGRNHHSAAFGSIAEAATGYEGFTAVLPRSTATVAEVLRQNGYMTAWVGKDHNTPPWEASAAGPFDRWPSGLGFDYFYGFMGGDTDQWHPVLYENRNLVPASTDPNYHLTDDLADHAIAWARQVKSIAPDRPFFLHVAPGATHAPHHAPQGVDRQVQGPVRHGLGQVPRDDLRAAEEARRRPGRCQAHAATGKLAGMGLAQCRTEAALRPHDGGVSPASARIPTTRWAASSMR